MSLDVNKKDAILSSAISLFAANGIDQTSISQIMEKSSLAKGTFYLYFLNKEQLIEDAFWVCHRMDVEACNEGMDNIANSADKLKKRAKNAILWALANPDEAKMERMYYFYRGFLGNGTYKKQFLHYNVVNLIVTEGISEGCLKPLPADLLGEIFYSAAAAVLTYIYEKPNIIDDEDKFDSLLDMVVAAIHT